MGIGAVKKVLKKATKGQKKVEPAVKQQRAYGKGQVKAATATGLTAAALAGMSLKELRAELKKAKLEKERALIKAAIEKTLREMATKDKDKNMNRGGTLRNGHVDMRKGGMFYNK